MTLPNLMDIDEDFKANIATPPAWLRGVSRVLRRLGLMQIEDTPDVGLSNLKTKIAESPGDILTGLRSLGRNSDTEDFVRALKPDVTDDDFNALFPIRFQPPPQPPAVSERVTGLEPVPVKPPPPPPEPELEPELKLPPEPEAEIAEEEFDKLPPWQRFIMTISGQNPRYQKVSAEFRESTIGQLVTESPTARKIMDILEMPGAEFALPGIPLAGVARKIPSVAKKLLPSNEWAKMTIPQRAQMAQTAGLEGKIGSKAWKSLTLEERQALSTKILTPEVISVSPEVTETIGERAKRVGEIRQSKEYQNIKNQWRKIQDEKGAGSPEALALRDKLVALEEQPILPKVEQIAGMPEAGLQPEMFGGVPTEVRPAFKTRIWNQKGEPVDIPVQGRKIVISGFEEFDLFVHKEAFLSAGEPKFGNRYHISEVTTGLRITPEASKTQREAIAKATETLNKKGIEIVRKARSDAEKLKPEAPAVAQAGKPQEIVPEAPQAIKKPVEAEVGIPGKEAAIIDVERELQARGIPPSGAEFAGNIRLSKYPDDIQEVIKQWAKENPDTIVEARRGIRTDEQVLMDARRLVDEQGGDFASIKRKWKPGEAWNAEEVTAIRGTLRAKSQEVMDLAAIARDNNSSANLAKLLLATEEQARLQEIVTGITAEAGRSLRAFRQETFNAIKANDAQKMEELLKRVGGREKMTDFADALSQLDVNDPIAINNFIRAMSKPKATDYITELWYNSILSGPKTHIINSLSNTITAITSPIERFGAAIVEQPLSLLQGRRVARFFSEVPADTFGALEGINEGIRGFAYTVRHGLSPSQATKWEFRPKAFKGVAGRVINIPSTMLEAADILYRNINYRAALNALAVRTAKMEKHIGARLIERIAELKNNPTTQMLKQADKIAEYRLFRQEAGTFASALMNLRDKFYPLRFVIPFLRTPINLLKFGLERSPAGVFNPKLWRNLAQKSPEASDQLARVFIGSSVAAFFAWQFAEGRITGAAPTDREARDRFYREGKLPYAVKIGDTWIQYQRLEPFNQVLSQVAAVVDAVKAKEKTIEQQVGQAIYSISQNLVSQTYMSSLSDLISMMTEPERYGTRFAQRQGVSLAIPFSSFVRTITQAIDPTIRQPETFFEMLKSNLPMFSREVPARLTVFGWESQRQTPAWSPISISTEDQTRVDAELSRLGIEVGFVGTMVAGRKLTRDEQQDYQRQAGQLTYQRLVTLFSSDSYPKTTDMDKDKMISRIITQSREVVRMDLPKNLWADYFSYYSLYKPDGMADSAARTAFRKSHPEFNEWMVKAEIWKPLEIPKTSTKTTTTTTRPRSVTTGTRTSR